MDKSPARAAPLLDRAHLDAHTFGDAELAAEVVGLFAGQCERLVPILADLERPFRDRADAAHTLKGGALGIGAMRLAALAAAYETADAGSAGRLAGELREVARATLAQARDATGACNRD